MVRYEAREHYAILTIDRPEARNAVNAAVAQSMEEGIDRLEGDEGLWVGILTGVPPVSCAGADLKEISAGKGDALRTERRGFAGIARRDRAKPMIAAVDGLALAGGTKIALACDLVVASQSATFGLPEVKRSLVASAGGLFRANAPIAVRQSREVVIGATNGPDEVGWSMSESARSTVMASSDFAEGVTAFLEKRLPHWTGR